jgi:ElaB/YqjD/DUF883 family membrane-anchored ribosome-binding protein
MANMRTFDTETDEQISEKVKSTASQVKDKASDMATWARDKAQEVGQSAVNKIDEGRESTAGALHSAATTMHETADTGARRISDAVHSAAHGIESTADYIRAHDTKQMMADVENVVKTYPGTSLLVAAAVGFLAGRAFRAD